MGATIAQLGWLEMELGKIKQVGQQIWNWAKGEILKVENGVNKFEKVYLPMIVGIVEQIKTAVYSNNAQLLADAIDELVAHGIANEVLGILKLAINKASAVLAALTLPSDLNDTNAWVAWLQQVFAILKVSHEKSAIWSTIAAHAVMEISAYENNGQAPSFAQAVALVEDVFQFAQTQLATA